MPGRNFLDVTGQRELARLARDLRALEDGRVLNDELRDELREIVAPAVRSVRASIRAIPSKGQSGRLGRRSLRAEMARAVEGKVRTTRRPGLIVRVNPRRMGPGRHNLPAYMEGDRPFHRWRHPVFGNTRVWVTQAPKPYFARAVRSVPDDAEDAARRAIDFIADRIED